MSPDVHFILTEEGFKDHEALLGEQGIEIRPKSRETVEDLEHGGISYVHTSGILWHEESVFAYDIDQNAEGIRLTVDAFAKSVDSGDALIAAIERAFPQPRRESPSLPQPPQRTLDKDSIVTTLGCLGILALLIAIGVFVVLGIRSVL